MATLVKSTSSNIPPVRLVNWMVHATYCPSTDDDTCQICKQKLTFMCSKCQGNKNIENIKCSISIGNCEHGFHYHCINKWINEGSNTCPIDQTTWKFKCENTDVSDWKKIVKNKSDVKNSVEPTSNKSKLEDAKSIYKKKVL